MLKEIGQNRSVKTTITLVKSFPRLACTNVQTCRKTEKQIKLRRKHFFEFIDICPETMRDFELYHVIHNVSKVG